MQTLRYKNSLLIASLGAIVCLAAPRAFAIPPQYQPSGYLRKSQEAVLDQLLHRAAPVMNELATRYEQKAQTPGGRGPAINHAYAEAARGRFTNATPEMRVVLAIGVQGVAQGKHGLDKMALQWEAWRLEAAAGSGQRPPIPEELRRYANAELARLAETSPLSVHLSLAKEVGRVYGRSPEELLSSYVGTIAHSEGAPTYGEWLRALKQAPLPGRYEPKPRDPLPSVTWSDDYMTVHYSDRGVEQTSETKRQD